MTDLDESDGPWVRGSLPGFGGLDSYHTDPTCPALERAKRPRAATDEEIERLDECGHCTDDDDTPQSSGDFSVYRAAVAAGKENDDQEAA